MLAASFSRPIAAPRRLPGTGRFTVD